MLSIIVVSGRFAAATQPSMDGVLAEAARTNAAIRDKVIALLNSDFGFLTIFS